MATNSVEWAPTNISIIKILTSLKYDEWQRANDISKDANLSITTTTSILRTLYLSGILNRHKNSGAAMEYCLKHPNKWREQ